MRTVGLRDLRFEARHGVHAEEAVLGGTYEVDVSVRVKVPGRGETGFGESPTLDTTLDYGSLHAIVTEVMRTATALIETIAEDIASCIWREHRDRVDAISVEVRKLNPPLGGRPCTAYVRLELDRAALGTT